VAEAALIAGLLKAPSKYAPTSSTSAAKLRAHSVLDKMLAAGVMPLVALKNTDTVRLLRFQSIASPAQALAGTWG
jgi:membrane peptidoglycan carboxypeptidase